MQHATLSTPPRTLLRVASSINDDALLPLRVPAPTIAFLHLLGKQCEHSTKPLGSFLLRVQSSQLADEIIRIVSPAELQTLRAEIKCLERAQEKVAADQEWNQAADLRDQVRPLKDRLRLKCQNVVIDVQPDHILRAIASLGFDQLMDLAGAETGGVESADTPNHGTC
jgi:hypothetical protein